jgi:hypothetical protein
MASMESLDYFERKVEAFRNAMPCKKHGKDHLVMCVICDDTDCTKCNRHGYCRCWCDYDSRGWD